jgi:hypothetical protein
MAKLKKPQCTISTADGLLPENLDTAMADADTEEEVPTKTVYVPDH